MNIAEHNKFAWDKEVNTGCQWTVPVTSDDVLRAKNGECIIKLSPVKPIPKEWIGDIIGKKVLCLASGGGQQGPLFAAMGADVTVFDISPLQLAQDDRVAKRDNLSIRTQQGDMRDLSVFPDEEFDLIYHPISNCFVDDVSRVWGECYRVLKRQGVLLAGFWNPINCIFDMDEWYNNKNLVIRYSIPYSDLVQLPEKKLAEAISNGEPLEFGHSLESQIGGQINAGFVINGFYEDSFENDLVTPYIDTVIVTRAVKL